jgi:hypothetical protein
LSNPSPPRISYPAVLSSQRFHDLTRLARSHERWHRTPPARPTHGRPIDDLHRLCLRTRTARARVPKRPDARSLEHLTRRVGERHSRCRRSPDERDCHTIVGHVANTSDKLVDLMFVEPDEAGHCVQHPLALDAFSTSLDCVPAGHPRWPLLNVSLGSATLSFSTSALPNCLASIIG